MYYNELKCNLCCGLLKSAIMTPCCKRLACHSCAKWQLEADGNRCWQLDCRRELVIMALVPEENIRMKVRQLTSKNKVLSSATSAKSSSNEILCPNGMERVGNGPGNLSNEVLYGSILETVTKAVKRVLDYSYSIKTDKSSPRSLVNTPTESGLRSVSTRPTVSSTTDTAFATRRSTNKVVNDAEPNMEKESLASPKIIAPTEAKRLPSADLKSEFDGVVIDLTMDDDSSEESENVYNVVSRKRKSKDHIESQKAQDVKRHRKIHLSQKLNRTSSVEAPRDIEEKANGADDKSERHMVQRNERGWPRVKKYNMSPTFEITLKENFFHAYDPTIDGANVGKRGKKNYVVIQGVISRGCCNCNGAMEEGSYVNVFPIAKHLPTGVGGSAGRMARVGAGSTVNIILSTTRSFRLKKSRKIAECQLYQAARDVTDPVTVSCKTDISLKAGQRMDLTKMLDFGPDPPLHEEKLFYPIVESRVAVGFHSPVAQSMQQDMLQILIMLLNPHNSNETVNYKRGDVVCVLDTVGRVSVKV